MMENEISKDPARPKMSEKSPRRCFERVARIAYLIASIFLYSMMLGQGATASETAPLAGNGSARAYNLTARTPANAPLKTDLVFAPDNRAKLNQPRGALTRSPGHARVSLRRSPQTGHYSTRCASEP